MSTREWSVDFSEERGEAVLNSDPKDGGTTNIRNTCNHLSLDVA